MGGGDTSLGGVGAAFPKTTWSLVLQIRDQEGRVSRDGLESLARRYWKPVYRYARIAWARSNEDAKDLVQAFLLWLAEGSVLARYDPGRGTLRTYLIALLDRFESDRERALMALKRGGGTRTLPLDEELARAQSLPSGPESDPRRAFEASWQDEVIRNAVDRVRRRARGDNEIPFRVFEAYSSEEPDQRPSYKEIATRLGIKESDVRNHLHAVREEIRAEMRAELMEQSGDLDSFHAEWKSLFGA